MGLYKLTIGYIYDLQYFFTGLDSKLYFLSNSVPAKAVILLKKKQTNFTTYTGIHIEVECTVADFIVFPSFEFLVDYSNGTIHKTERMLGLKGQQEGTCSASHRLTESTVNEVSVLSIRCRAPFRNSIKEAEAILLIRALLVKPAQKEQTLESSERAETSTSNDSFETTPLTEPDSSSSSQNIAVVLTVMSVVILLGSVVCTIYAVRKYKKSTELRQLTLDEINEFFNGNAAIAPGSSNAVNVDGIGFPESFQIPAGDLKMHVQEVLGEGEFGRCVSGHFHDQKVAVKTTKASMDVEAFKQFLREVKIMAYLEKHENIVEFLGAGVNQLRDRICMAVVELSPYGDLLSYLRQNGKENPSHVNSYANLLHVESLECPEGAKLGTSHLCYFCEQIAAAMEFVVEKRVIHGDLAARNVLVFPDYVVKITDFGLSRKLYTASNYKKKNNTPLPWRWMAIESLKYMEFSPMTDMWAYGVTVWEIFTMGEVPYAGHFYSREFVDKLEQGRRLQRPKNASEEIYQFMKLTWERIPSARPSFQDAKNFFRRHMLDASSGGIRMGGL